MRFLVLYWCGLEILHRFKMVLKNKVLYRLLDFTGALPFGEIRLIVTPSTKLLWANPVVPKCSQSLVITINLSLVWFPVVCVYLYFPFFPLLPNMAQWPIWLSGGLLWSNICIYKAIIFFIDKQTITVMLCFFIGPGLTDPVCPSCQLDLSLSFPESNLASYDPKMWVALRDLDGYRASHQLPWLELG